MVTLGIDIGTTSICAVLYDCTTDREINSINRENEFITEAGSFCQNPDKIVSAVEMMIEDICPEQKEIAGIGISSQMHGILYIDKNGKAVSPFYTWKNEDGNKIYRDRLTYAEYLQVETGYELYSGYGTVTHFYKQKNYNIAEDAVAFVSIGDYVAGQLTGNREAAAEASMAAGMGGYDLLTRQFDLKMLQRAGVDTSYFPKVIRSRKMAGIYHIDEKEIPVFYALGDNQASFMGAVTNKEETVSINVGTGAQVSVFGKKFDRIEGIDVRPVDDRGYLYVGASLNGGKIYERLALFIEEICESFTGQKVDAYERMYQIANEKKNTDLIARPNLYGGRFAGKKEAGINHLTEDNFHPEDFIRSFVNGMAAELFELYQNFPAEVKKGKTQIAGSGNGIRKNILLQEEIKKVFGLPVIFRDIKEEAAVGAAMHAHAGLAERGMICR